MGKPIPYSASAGFIVTDVRFKFARIPTLGLDLGPPVTCSPVSCHLALAAGLTFFLDKTHIQM